MTKSKAMVVFWKPLYWCGQFDYILYSELAGGRIKPKKVKGARK